MTVTASESPALDSASDTPIVELLGVGRSFGEGDGARRVLRGIDLRLAAGEWVALMGASGSGKTTLLSVIGGLDPHFEGEAAVFGASWVGKSDDERTELRHRHIGFIFQAFHLLEHLSVLENIELPLWLDAPRPDTAEAARAALVQVGLGDRAEARVPSLSGGERQRVAIARALATSPRLLLADEPTGNLDDETSGSILDLFDEIRAASGRALLVATHDPRVARRADRVLRLEEGRLLEGEAVE